MNTFNMYLSFHLVEQLERDTQKDLERDELVVYENGQEVAVINNIDQITNKSKHFFIVAFIAMLIIKSTLDQLSKLSVTSRRRYGCYLTLYCSR